MQYMNMHRLSLWLVRALVSGGIVTGVAWFVRDVSQRGKPAEYRQSATASLSEVPTVVFCDLLANPMAYDMKVIRVHAVLVVNHDYRALYDPSCITKEPMVSVEKEAITAAHDYYDNCLKGVL